MKQKRPSDPALWFFFGAAAASLPWSFFLTPPTGLSPRQLEIIGAIWRFVFLVTSFVSALGYAGGIAVFKEHSGRRLSMAVGIIFGCGIVAVSRLPRFDTLDFITLFIAGLLAGLLAGIVIGFRKRKARAV